MVRFTRSMARGNAAKTPVPRNARIDTVVIDDEAEDLPVNDQSVEHEFNLNFDHDNPPPVDKEVQVNPVIGHPTEENPVELSSPGSYCIDGMMHPLFINCLLDKIRIMEERVKEVAANRDSMKDDNAELMEKMVFNDK